MINRAYLDHNATTALRPEARDAMMEAFAYIGNPSSIHTEGRAARALIEDVRQKIAGHFGVETQGVTFTSGGTEAANWLLRTPGGRPIAISAVEHACVMRGHAFDGNITVVPVSKDGIIDLAALAEVVSPGSLVAVQAANNETGIVQPLSDVVELVKAKGATLVCDAVQAIGRVPREVVRDVDVFFISAHKFGGPKGVGAVVRRNGEPNPPLITGGGQERSRRSGTENVSGIAGMGAAFEAAIRDQANFATRARAMRTKLESGIRSIAPDAVVFGEGLERLPNTTCFVVPGKRADMLLIAFDLEGVAVSSGSACSSGKVEGSSVLAAMGVQPALIEGAIRVSTGWNTEDADIERLLAALSKICSDRHARHAA